MEALINFVQNEFIEKKEFPKFDAGDTLTVYYQIREGEKVRTQFFKGVVIQIKGQGLSKTFTIRKMSGTVGVERIFPDLWEERVSFLDKHKTTPQKAAKDLLKILKAFTMPSLLELEFSCSWILWQGSYLE